MANDRFPYKTSQEYTQPFLDQCYINTTTELRMVAEIETPSGTLYVSDRNLYVGGRFYEARVKFPLIERKLDDWLSWRSEANTLELEVSNADGKFSHLLTGGAAFGLWVGKEIVVRVGLRDVEDSYRVVYRGYVSETGGLERRAFSFILLYEDALSKLKVELPRRTFQREQYPDLEGRYIGVNIPIFYGDWKNDMPNSAVVGEPNQVVGVPAYVVNGLVSLPSAAVDVEVVVSDYYNYNIESEVFVERFGTLYKVHADDISEITTHGAKVKQNTGNTKIEEENYIYSEDDRFFLILQNTEVLHDNPVSQCKYLMKTWCGYTDEDFDNTSWDYFSGLFEVGGTRESLSRIAIYEPVSADRYCSVLLGQVQLQMFIDSKGKINLFSTDFEDFKNQIDTTSIKQADIVKNSLAVRLRDNNSFNRCRASFAYNPRRRENHLYTAHWKNTVSIAAIGREIPSQTLQFPNLYIRSQVEYHLKQILKLSSAFFEEVEVGLTWRHMLQDLGEYTKQSYIVSQLEFKGTPAVFRRITHNPDYSLSCSLWCLQQVPFGDWSGGEGSIGGDASIIEAE